MSAPWVDAARMTVRGVISTAEPDRAGDVVVPAGLANLDDFLRNPVVLWAHERVLFPPVGMCEWLDVQPGRIVAQTRFAQDVRHAEDVFRLYEQGVLRAWSIAFAPRRSTPADPLPRGPRFAQPARRGGVRVEEWDLLEYSAVPVPENPGALTAALQKGVVRDPHLRAWLARVPDDRGGRFWPTGGDVLSDVGRTLRV